MVIKAATAVTTSNSIERALNRRSKTSLPPCAQSSTASKGQQASIGFGLSIIFIFLFTLIRTQHLLEDLESRACMEIPNILFKNSLRVHKDDSSVIDRYIIFEPILEGQGTGNIMSGLLAVHLLGLEFNRTVCVSQSYFKFHVAFEAASPAVAAACRQLLECEQPIVKNEDRIELINYRTAPNECALKEKLESETRILWMVSNTYPRWPKHIPGNFFFTNYQPRKRLLDMLPYPHDDPPRTVVHLRLQDCSRDFRKGLDNETLHSLGKSLPKEGTYLVTNHVEWFDLFERQYGWSHPTWDSVTHSALAVSWGDRKGDSVRRIVRGAEQDVQTMQLWADWWTLLNAQYIVHTASDFSSSAAHWMNVDSMVIEGSDSNADATMHQVRLAPEDWRHGNIWVPLVERTRDAQRPETEQLQLCDEDPRLDGAMAVVSAARLAAPKLKIKGIAQ